MGYGLSGFELQDTSNLKRTIESANQNRDILAHNMRRRK